MCFIKKEKKKEEKKEEALPGDGIGEKVDVDALVCWSEPNNHWDYNIIELVWFSESSSGM